MVIVGTEPEAAENKALFLDCGNSRCKYSIGGQSGVWYDPVEAMAAIDEWCPERVVIATVSAFGRDLIAAIEAAPQHRVSRMEVRNGWLGVSISYPDPGLYGIDRWLTLIAARSSRENVVIVDAGTALTIDALDAEGRHLGGYILPGLALMRRTLVNDTFALPEAPPGQGVTPGHTTADAIANGAVLALSSVVSASLVQYGLDRYRLIWTGGDASLLAAHTSPVGELKDDLVIDGMRILYKDTAYMESLG